MITAMNDKFTCDQTSSKSVLPIKKSQNSLFGFSIVAFFLLLILSNSKCVRFKHRRLLLLLIRVPLNGEKKITQSTTCLPAASTRSHTTISRYRIHNFENKNSIIKIILN